MRSPPLNPRQVEVCPSVVRLFFRRKPMNLSTTGRAMLLALSLTLIALPTSAQVKRPLSEKEDPELIGKRNINKHQVNFYSLDKEVALGRQLAAEVDRAAKFVGDPIVVEYINRIGQNLV